jgi:hypothetical protein
MLLQSKYILLEYQNSISINANAHMYEIVGGLRATLLSAVNRFATGSGVAYAHINPQYFIHDVVKRFYSIVVIFILVPSGKSFICLCI